MRNNKTAATLFYIAAALFFLGEGLNMLSTEPKNVGFYAIAGFVSLIFGFVALPKKSKAVEAKQEENATPEEKKDGEQE